VEENEKMKTSLEYTKLSKNWIFLLLQMVPTDFENKERLCRKNDSNGESETTDPTKHVTSSSTVGIKQGIQPLAYYLPHAEIYVLPYVTTLIKNLYVLAMKFIIYKTYFIVVRW
jgi:hypothetical protein